MQVIYDAIINRDKEIVEQFGKDYCDRIRKFHKSIHAPITNYLTQEELEEFVENEKKIFNI